MENKLEMGQVKTIRSSGGKVVDYVELLLSSDIGCSFVLDKDNNQTIMSIGETECAIKKETIRDLYISLRDMYKQLLDEEEIIVEEEIPSEEERPSEDDENEDDTDDSI